MKSNVDLYLNADKTRVVLDGPEAAYVLVNAGRELPDAALEKMGGDIFSQAKKLGSKAAAKEEDKAVPAPSKPEGGSRGRAASPRTRAKPPETKSAGDQAPEEPSSVDDDETDDDLRAGLESLSDDELKAEAQESGVGLDGLDDRGAIVDAILAARADGDEDEKKS